MTSPSARALIGPITSSSSILAAEHRTAEQKGTFKSVSASLESASLESASFCRWRSNTPGISAFVFARPIFVFAKYTYSTLPPRSFVDFHVTPLAVSVDNVAYQCHASFEMLTSCETADIVLQVPLWLPSNSKTADVSPSAFILVIANACIAAPASPAFDCQIALETEKPVVDLSFRFLSFISLVSHIRFSYH